MGSKFISKPLATKGDDETEEEKELDEDDVDEEELGLKTSKGAGGNVILA